MMNLVRRMMLMAGMGACVCAAPQGATAAGGQESIVLAGGCFWGVEAVFQHMRGVSEAVSGYAGGTADTARYDLVSTGGTGHAEAVRVSYDPAQLSLDTLLTVYFTVAHDPTQLDYQGPDWGTQYRSAVFYATPEQKQAAEAVIKRLTEQKLYAQPIVTTLEKLEAFYPAEAYHQGFAGRNPDHPYICVHDKPKVERLKEAFPEIYVGD